jgi:hypothetical protein
MRRDDGVFKLKKVPFRLTCLHHTEMLGEHSGIYSVNMKFLLDRPVAFAIAPLPAPWLFLDAPYISGSI